MSGGYQRTDRVADLIKREVAAVIAREVRDPRLAMLTVTAVKISPDLRLARVYYTVMDDSVDRDAVRQGLVKACGYVQRKVGSRVHLRYTPQLVFEYDDSIREGARMSELLRHIEQDLDGREQDDGL